jgi:hypothetical protein
MDVVIRGVNQRFLDEVAFPVFAQGATDSAAALERLLDLVDDAELRLAAQALVERGAPGGWSEVDLDRFQEVVYRLLFHEWRRTPGGWVISSQSDAYAGPLDQAVNSALMLTDASYPYWDLGAARAERERVIAPPYLEQGLAAFLCGLWAPFPEFAPGELLTTRGTNVYLPAEQVALADWSWRPPSVVAAWSADLPRALRDLMDREQQRLRPIEVPESQEVVDYWMGRTPEPPQLVVGFTGLGGSTTWVRDIAALAGQIRRAASREQGLTAIITGGVRSWF